MANKRIKYDREKYLTYLRSADWLIKKSKLVVYCVNNNINVSCLFCESTNNIQVHHLTYDTLYNEDLLMDLAFMCDSCHKKHHEELK